MPPVKTGHLFYQGIKIIARLSLWIFCRRRILECESLVHCKGPAILASNHPDSMMDAVLLGSLCRRPVHFIIRSDMFNKPLFRWLLNRLGGIPVYRQSEEKEKMRQNNQTLEICKKILLQDGIILIFPEGSTDLDWKLKPLKSGTARIIRHCLEDEMLRTRLKVVPTGIAYNSFRRFSKTVYIRSGEPFYPGRMDWGDNHGNWKKNFNRYLFYELLPLAPQMTSHSREKISIWKIFLTNCPGFSLTGKESRFDYLMRTGQKLSERETVHAFYPPDARYHSLAVSKKNFVASLLLTLCLSLPSVAGLALNGAFYFIVRSFVWRKTRDSIFFDSLSFALLSFLYPVYAVIISLTLHFITHLPAWLWLFIMPVSGWMLVHGWHHFQRCLQYLKMSNKDKSELEEWLPGHP